MKTQPLQHRHPLSVWLAAVIVPPLTALWPGAVQAASGTWTPTAAGPFGWSAPANWSGSVVAGGNPGDVATFSPVLTAAQNSTLDGNRILGTLNFTGTAAFAFNIVGNNGGSLIMDNGAGTAAINFTGSGTASTIAAPIVLNSDLEISATLAGGNAFVGNITGTKGLTIDSNGLHTAATVSSVGDIVIRGYNSYSGGTTITEARLQAYNSWSMGSGAVTVNNGGGIYMPNGGYWKNNMTLSGLGWNETTGILGAIRSDANSVFTGTITAVAAGATPARINSHGTMTALFNGVITGGAGDGLEFTESGTGTATWVLNNTNTWAGTARIGRATAAAGTSILAIGANNNQGTLGTGDVFIDTGGILAFNRSDTITVANNILAGAGGLAQNGLGQTTLTAASILNTGANSASGLNSRLIFNPGGSGGALTLAATPGTLTLSNYADVEFKSSSATYAASINGGRGTYVIVGSGTNFTMGGATDNSSGKAWVEGGTLVLGKASAATVHSLGAPYVQYGLVQSGGTVQFGGSGADQIFDQTPIRQTGGSIDLNGFSDTVGTLTGTGGSITNTNAAASTLTIGASVMNGASPNTGIFFDNNVAGGATPIDLQNYRGAIADGVGTVAITKGGNALQVLSGTNTYTGATTVNAGFLSVTGSTAAAGTVNVTGGSLAGTGSVGNIVVSVTAGSTVRPGATGFDRDAVGTLNGTSLTVNGGDLRLNYGAGGNDTIALTGAANFAAASTVTPVFTAPPTIGTTTIVTGGAAPTLGVVPTVTLPATSRITGGTVGAAGNNVTLTLAGANAKALTWSGGTGTWDLNTTANFDAGLEKFFNLDSVTFANSSVGTVTLAAGTYVPTGIIDNTTGANNVTLSGTGVISGSAGIIKNGDSTLTISTPNTFTGDVMINAGTLIAGNAGALGDVTGETFISSGATLDVNAQNLGAEIFNISGTGVGGNGAIVNNSLTGQINATRFVRLTGDASVGGNGGRWDVRESTGNGGGYLDLAGNTLTKVGSNYVALVGVNVSDGNLVLNAGTLSLETSSVIQGTGTITANSGLLQYYQTVNGNITRPTIWAGADVTNAAQNGTVNSPISMTKNTTLLGTGATLIFGGNLAESGGSFGITKNEGSTYNFAGNVSYTGLTAVNNGTLTLAGLNTASSSAVNSVNATGAVTLGGALAPVSGGTTGNLNLGGGGYTTIAGAPSSVTINSGTFAINTRVSNTLPTTLTNVFTGGANQFTITGVEQETTTTLTGSIGNTTKYGNLNVFGGTVNVSAASPLNLRFVEVNNTNGAGSVGSGANTGTLNITGGDHKVTALFTGNGSNSSGVVNMSGGTLTFETNGNATLQSTNNSGYAMFGQSGLRIGHFGNGNNVPNQFNLSGGILDASKVTVSVGWDGAGFLNVTGGTLKAKTLAVDGNGNTALPAYNRLDVSGNARVEIGYGGMPTLGSNSSINVGDSSWVAVESGEWTRGFNLLGNTTVDTGTNRVAMTGQNVGAGNLTKNGNGILQLGGANINTGSLTINGGLLRMANAQALGDGTVVFAANTTVDTNGADGDGTAIRPSSITLAGGGGAPGALGAIVNTTGTGGFGVDAGGTITIQSDTTVYATSRYEIGTNNVTVAAGTNEIVKNGQGQMIWRSNAASTVGNITVNGGHFYAEDNDNNLGSTAHTITANTGGMISAWQGDTTTTQNKPLVLNGGAIMADRNSTWTGGLTVTADSKAFRNAGNADARLTFDGPLNLNAGTTLTFRDRLPVANPTVFTNNASSGDGSLDIHSSIVNIGANSTFNGRGEIKIRTDALVNLDATATVTKSVNLAGGVLSDTTPTARNLTMNSTGSGYARTMDPGGSMSLGTLNLFGAAATTTSSRTGGMMFGSGTGYTANATPGAAMGAISLTNNSILLNNPNFTVSSNPFVTTGNDTTFAMWDGSKVTGVAPTQATLAASGASDLPMVVANETVVASQTVANLITDATVTLDPGVTLKLAQGGVILREAAAAGWNGAGAITSGRSDGVLGLTMTNAFTSALVLGGGDVGGFTVGNVSNNPISGAPDAFRPVTLAVNGYGNATPSANQAFTGGTFINGGRINQQNYNSLGLGAITVREGGTMLVNAPMGLSNNMSAAGLGAMEGGGYLFGALRLGGGGGMGAATGTISLDSSVVRMMATDNTTILGNVTGTGSFQRAGSGQMWVRSAASYSGATHIGIDGAGGTGGTHSVFVLADGGTASSLGASGNAASNLVLLGSTLNYIGGTASTDRLFTIAPSMTTSAAAATIVNNGYGNLNFTNTGAVVMGNGSTDATLTLTANNYTANTFTPTLSNPSNARLNVTVNGPGSWELNGSSYNINGTVALSGGVDLILNTAADITIPVLTAGGRSILVKNGAGTLTLGGAGLGTDADNGSGQITVNAGTVVFDKRGSNGFNSGAIVGASGTGRISALGASGVNTGDGLLLNGGTVRYAPTANMDQIFDSVDVRINGGTLDFNGRSDTFDSLNGTGGTITNGLAGTISQVGIGNATSLPSALNFTAKASYGGTIQDGAGQIELVKLGNGVQEFSGTNTYTGKTSAVAGLLRISSETNLGANPASFDLSHLILAGGGLETSANVTIDDANRGVWVEKASPLRPDAGTNLTLATAVAGPGNLDVVGKGTVTLSGANIYTGATSLYRGTLALDYSTSDTSKLSNTSALVLRGGNLVMSGGTHVEVVSATTIDGGGVNTGASYISNSGGRTAAINLNAITRAIGNGGTLDLGANGTATTDSNNTNGILASAGASGFTGTAYATVGKTNWAQSVTSGAADTAITGFTGYTATGHHDAAAGASSPGTVDTLRLNQAAGSAISGTTVLRQQGILMTPAAGASSIAGTLTGFAAQTAAISTDLAVHQHSANDLTISAVIANTTAATFVNTTALTKSGNGRLILTGVNTYTGITYINEGILELQGSGQVGNNVAGSAVWVDGTFSLNRAGAYTVANNMGGGATGMILKKDNTGIATLGGGIGSYAGGATVSQGALVTLGDAFGNANATNELAANGTVYGTITLGDAGTGATDNVIYSDARGAAHTVRKDIVVTNTGSTGLAIIGAGTVTNAADGTGASKGNFATIHQGTVQLNRPTIFRGNTGDRLTFQGAISGNVGTLTIDAPDMAAVAINTNPGRVTMEATNTFVGDVVVNGAILQVGTGALADPQDQIPDASNVTLNGVSAAKQAGLTLNGDSETINNLNGDVNTFIQSAASSSATMMRLTVNGTGTFSGLFHGGNNTGMTLEKAGSGTFTLAGTADNNTGRVLVSGGTLQFAKASSGSVHAIGADSVIQGGTLLLGGTGGDQIYNNISLTMYGGTLDMGGTNETVQNIFSNPGVGTITNSGGAPSTLTLGSNNGSSLLGAKIQDGTSAVALSKTGNGGAVLTGANIYTGATTITGGYVQLGTGGTTGSIATTSSVITSANTQLVFNRSDNVVFAPPVSGGGGLVQNGGGVLEIPAGTTDTYTGPTVVNSGELKVNGSIATSAVTLNPGTTLSGSGFTGPVGSMGGIIKPGNSPGILTTGSVVAGLDSSFVYELNGSSPGTGYDQIQVNGLVDIGATSVFTFTASYTPDPLVDRFYLIVNDGADPIDGLFVGIPEGQPVTVNGQPYYYTYQADSASNQSFGGNDFALIPEPSAAVLMLLLGGAGLLRRRRNA